MEKKASLTPTVVRPGPTRVVCCSVKSIVVIKRKGLLLYETFFYQLSIMEKILVKVCGFCLYQLILHTEWVYAAQCTLESGLRRNLWKVHTFSSYPKISSKTVWTLNMLIINEFKYCYLRKQLFIHLLMFFHQNNRYRLYSNQFAHKSVSLSYVCLNGPPI